MLADIKEIIRKDNTLQYILFAGLLLQLMFSLFTTGFYQADQHFQVIEFSSYQLGQPNATSHIWEFEQAIRPTLQVYIFSAYRSVLEYIGISDPYLQLTILRIIMGMLLFIVFNIIAIYYSKDQNKKVIYIVLIILNFSWCIPYTRTLFSSEMLSSLFFFTTAFMYDRKKDKNLHFVFLLLTGFLFCLAFYFRFQAAFLIIGFIIWMLFIQKKWKHLPPIAIGFIIGALLNTWMDHEFYNKFVITPYEYYYTNIVLKKAASFSTVGPHAYVGVLLAITAIFPISIFLYYYAIKVWKDHFKHILSITVLSFILAHCLVSHKEERFMFSILPVLPVIIGWGIPFFMQYYTNCKTWIRIFIKSMIALSILLNTIGLFLLLFHNPRTQLIGFTSKLKDHLNKTSSPSKIYSFARSPFITSSGLPISFYANGFKNTEIVLINDIDSVRQIKEEHLYLTTAFRAIKGRQGMIDSLGFKPIFYSSGLLWKLNVLFYRKKMSEVSEVWVLYKK